MSYLCLKNVHPSWQPLIETALEQVDESYLTELQRSDWLPGPSNIFNAFSLPLENTRYILFGESPYPRAQSANGYAFWDAAVTDLWSKTGLSKPVNRATSLRNIMKALLIANGNLSKADTSQPAIAQLDKSDMIVGINELFANLLSKGFLLLNASPVFRSAKLVKADGKAWLRFIQALLEQLRDEPIQLVLWGKIAQVIEKLPISQHFSSIVAEHPYNLSFVTNPKILNFLNPLNLLEK
tara:strand:- start:79222 stop:79938 length:717 start_codon:yes stop_codon:yes gene_type:complete